MFIKSLLLTMAFSLSTFAGVNDYDSLMADCLDYGHRPASEEKMMKCHIQTRETLLASMENQMKYLDCIDYGHQEISLEKEISCLQELGAN